MNYLKFVCVVTLLVGLAAAPSFGETVTLTANQPASLLVSTSAEGCFNNPGPQITIEGQLTLGGVNARIIATNNRKLPAQHSGSEDVFVDVALVPAAETIHFAKQPPNGGAGGNPHIYAWFNNCSGEYLTKKPTYLGRCVQGLSDAALNFDMLTDVAMNVTSGSCSNSPGPHVTLDGELTLGGVCATLIFSNNANMKHTHKEEVEVQITLLELGEQIIFNKQGSLEDGVTGNPWLWLQLLDGAGEEMSKPILLGKCVQL